MNRFQTLRPLVQLVPAVVVAGAILITLPRTAPVLAEVPERLAAPAASSQAADSVPAEPEETLPRLPYADGTYTGSSRGYGGPVKVQVTMAEGRITDLQILNASHETSSFLRRAKRLLALVLQEQTWEVDAVSEATYTSRGILGAIRNALTGEEVHNPVPPQPAAPEPLTVETFTAPSAYQDGIYTASAEGFGGPITVQVTVSNDTIVDISIVDASEETHSYFTRARKVIPAILSSGTPEVDTISGATYSSTGILNAVKLALAKAATDAATDAEPPASSAEEVPEEAAETPDTPLYPDGVYTGTSEGPDGPVTVSVTVTDGAVAGVSVLPTEAASSSFWARLQTGFQRLFRKSAHEAPAASAVDEATLEQAIQNALQQTPTALPEEAPASSAPADLPAAAESIAPAASAPAEAVPAEAPAPSDASVPETQAPQYRDGTYSAVAVCTDAEDFHYDVRVTLTISGGAVTEVQVQRENDVSETPADNRPYLDRARNGKTAEGNRIAGLTEQILQKQSADSVDLVSGATYSSRAIQSAAQQALQQAT